MKVEKDGKILAQSDETIEIEGHHYFPKQSVSLGGFLKNDTEFTCPWKGEAEYYDIVAGDERLTDAAWSYPEPNSEAIQKVGEDFSGYIAFDLSQVDTA